MEPNCCIIASLCRCTHTENMQCLVWIWSRSSSLCCAVYSVCLLPCRSWGCWTWEADQHSAAPRRTRPPWWSWSLGAGTAWPRLWIVAGRCAETPATRAASRALLQGAPENQSLCSLYKLRWQESLSESTNLTTHHYRPLILPVLFNDY